MMRMCVSMPSYVNYRIDLEQSLQSTSLVRLFCSLVRILSNSAIWANVKSYTCLSFTFKFIAIFMILLLSPIPRRLFLSFPLSLSVCFFFVLRLSKSAEMMARNAMDRRWFDWCCLFHILLQTHNQPFLLCQWKLKKLKCKITVIPSGIKLVCLVLCFFFVVCLLFPPPFPFYIYFKQ